MVPERYARTKIDIKDVIFNGKCTIVFWTDNTKTIVRLQDDSEFDPEKAIAMAIAKKAFGNKGSYYNHIRPYVQKYEDSQAEKLTIGEMVDQALAIISRIGGSK